MIKSLLKNKRLMMVLAVAWTILIFIGCSLPGRDLPPISVFDHFDKLVHITFFIVFALLWLLAIKNPSRLSYIFIVLISFIYGFGLEYYQINFVPGRSWDVWDGAADTLGGLIGVGGYHAFSK